MNSNARVAFIFIFHLSFLK